MNKDQINELSNKIIGIAIKVHKKLGPGFLEKIYEKAFAYELKREGINFIRQKPITIPYENLGLDGQRVDFLVEDEIILDLKSVSEINKIHEAQLLSYLKSTDKRLGLILNFAKKRLGIKRMVNNF